MKQIHFKILSLNCLWASFLQLHLTELWKQKVVDLPKFILNF